MSDTDVRRPKPTPHPQSSTVAPFRISERVTIETTDDDAMYVNGQTGTVTDVERDTDEAWGPWTVRVLVPGFGTLAFKASELRRTS